MPLASQQVAKLLESLAAHSVVPRASQEVVILHETFAASPLQELHVAPATTCC